MKTTDMAGYPRRHADDHLQFKSTARKFIVLSVLRPAVLCPCPDSLFVRFSNGDELYIDNSDDIERQPIETYI